MSNSQPRPREDILRDASDISAEADSDRCTPPLLLSDREALEQAVKLILEVLLDIRDEQKRR
jgi:hypothetical protein